MSIFIPRSPAGIAALLRAAIRFAGSQTSAPARLNISLDHNFDKLVRNIEPRAKKHLAFATAKALTKTAQLVKRDLQQEMTKVFDRPTPYTKNAIYIKPATKEKLEARVWLKDGSYLLPQIFGGSRKLKRFEKSLASAGLLPAGMHAVPGSAAQLDAYGNMQRGQLVRILSSLRAFGEQGYSANMNAKQRGRLTKRTRSAYFVGRPGGGKFPLGVWETKASGFGRSVARPVIMFVRASSYRKRFRFFEVAQNTVQIEFEDQFKQALAEAING